MYMTLQLKNSFKADGSSTQQYSNIHSWFLYTKYLINTVQNFKQPLQSFSVFQLWPYYFKCAHVKKSMILGRRHDLCKKS
jgi:hypothetical protein